MPDGVNYSAGFLRFYRFEASSKGFVMSYTLRCLLVASLMLSVAGCRNYTWQDAENSTVEKTYMDRDFKLNHQDYNKALAPKAPIEKAARGSSLDLAPVVAEDQRDVLPQPLVSVTVNQDVPIRDIFYELAKQAQVDLELDPDIRGSVIFTAYNRPFDSVVERLADIAGLRYNFENNVLRVEMDRPYMKVYRIDYTGLTRKFTSEIKSNTGVDASAIGASGGGGGQNGSKSTITTDISADFWKEIETNLSQLLEVGRYQQRQGAKTAAPLTTPNAIPAVTTEQLASTGAPSAGAQPSAAIPMSTEQKEEEKLESSGGLGDPYFAINKQAGLINIFASAKQHNQVANYLTQLRKATSTQVLIEAKVLEVALNNEYSMGIDWNQFVASDLILNATLTNPNFLINPATTQAFNIGVNGDDFRAVLSALSRFGTARTLSSPRLTVMNNQSALLNVSENRVFFDLDVTVQQGTGLGVPPMMTVNSEIRSVPEGIIINVHPTVDVDTNQVTMNLRPSITKIVGQVEDPAVAFVAGGTALANNIPIVAVREMDSVVQMRSGETIVLGGLMQDSNQSTQVAVPVLGEIPIVGGLFRSQGDMNKKTELVILIKASVITPRPHETDKELYETFGRDRRPIAMK
jgi:MSHA biogenesis protein MshL